VPKHFELNRRSFLKSSAIAVSATGFTAKAQDAKRAPGRIPNEYSLFLKGEREALANVPAVSHFEHGKVNAAIGAKTKEIRLNDEIDGWKLLALPTINGTPTAVFEKHVTHQGAIVYLTESEGVIAHIPKGIGDLSKIRPRPVDARDVKLERLARYTPGPDVAGNYILSADEDPSYETVAALGKEFIGWTLVANEEAGPLRSLYLGPDGISRQLGRKPDGQGQWAPDLTGALFDPGTLLLSDNPQVFEYVPGYSKRTLLGGYLPVADTGVWNPTYRAGYEVIVLLPPGIDAEPVARVRSVLPDQNTSDRYWNATPESFYSALVGIWNRWHNFFQTSMPVDIPDRWLLDSVRAGIVLSRCSYRGLEPTYQVGEGAYTKIPERSHALFPVASYEFIWAHQLWNLTAEAEPYFQLYLQKYILPDGNFTYNTQDQVEAPLNVGIFLANAARAYDYSGNLPDLESKLPALRRMLGYVLKRYEYSKQRWKPDDRQYGLIWGSPEADLGDPQNDFPQSHPLYYQNSVWIWRGLKEYARCLAKAGSEHNRPVWQTEAKQHSSLAEEMRSHIERSLKATIESSNPQTRGMGIPPFSPDDIHRKPNELSNYENHRFMPDWFTADWGDPALDLGHLKHRELSGYQIMGMATDAKAYRVSNFMEHGTLAVRIRQDDYRPFLLLLYSLVCYAADSGNRYSPEDAFVPGGYAGEGNPYTWSAVVNSALQPALGLRWLLCYEEGNRDICHLQKAAPRHWFSPGQKIAVRHCPTRFGKISWRTEVRPDSSFLVTVELEGDFRADLLIHVHRADGAPLQSTSIGTLAKQAVALPRALLQGKREIELTVR
jgi:hypothetical protein